jgi:hypothetical protein
MLDEILCENILKPLVLVLALPLSPWVTWSTHLKLCELLSQFSYPFTNKTKHNTTKQTKQKWDSKVCSSSQVILLIN